MTTDKHEHELGIGECSVQCWICPYCHDDHADPKVCNQDYLRERIQSLQSEMERTIELYTELRKLSDNNYDQYMKVKSEKEQLEYTYEHNDKGKLAKQVMKLEAELEALKAEKQDTPMVNRKMCGNYTLVAEENDGKDAVFKKAEPEAQSVEAEWKPDESSYLCGYQQAVINETGILVGPNEGAGSYHRWLERLKERPIPDQTKQKSVEADKKVDSMDVIMQSKGVVDFVRYCKEKGNDEAEAVKHLYNNEVKFFTPLIEMYIAGKKSAKADQPQQPTAKELLEALREHYEKSKRYWLSCNSKSGVEFKGINGGALIEFAEQWLKTKEQEKR
jgi:hypothetical protein